MHKESVNNVQLGFFVLIGTAFLIGALYLIGNNRNLFSSTFQITATFNEVNGLMKGNSVRLSGIDVGTVKSVKIESDTSVRVIMIIENEARRFIKKNAFAALGTDGLMGNKLVNIENMPEPDKTVEDGDVIKTIRPIQTDQMMRTLDRTNENLSFITADLKRMTQKLSSSNSLWSVLTDTVVAQNVKQAISSIRATTKNTTAFTEDLNGLLRDMRKGKGIINYLASDTISPAKLKESILQINEASAKAVQVVNDLKQVTERIKKGDGPAGVLLSDTTFANDLSKSMRNIRIGSEKLSENMDAMRQNFLFRGYFKDKEKKERKDAEKGNSRK